MLEGPRPKPRDKVKCWKSVQPAGLPTGRIPKIKNRNSKHYNEHSQLQKRSAEPAKMH